MRVPRDRQPASVSPDVVNVGIGGSDLGPAMATLALAPYRDGPRCHFVSNVDGAHITDTLRILDPGTTLVIMASKTFTTVETMTNARTALSWLRGALGEEAVQSLAAVSTALDRTTEMGIAPDRVFGFADWVGGRYSLWGPVGLPIMLAVGPDDFRDFLAGGAAMDRHFRSAPFERNMPILLGLVGIWHRDICQYPTRAVIPYDQRLARLPAYLQQLDMESNGKCVSIDGQELELPTGPVVWGEPGTNAQHAFFQLLHQGTEVVPVEFLVAAEGHEANLREHHDMLKANCLAQSEALMIGRTFDQAMEIAAGLGYSGQERRIQAAHRYFPGNRPSTTLAYQRLTPFTLGQIISLYEHRVFTEGAIWGINSFDQWGVELGKELAGTLLPMMKGTAGHSQGSVDASPDPASVSVGCWPVCNFWIRLSRHCRDRTSIPFSAMPGQLPCFRVWWTPERSAIRERPPPDRRPHTGSTACGCGAVHHEDGFPVRKVGVDDVLGQTGEVPPPAGFGHEQVGGTVAPLPRGVSGGAPVIAL